MEREFEKSHIFTFSLFLLVFRNLLYFLILFIDFIVLFDIIHKFYYTIQFIF